MKRRRLGILGVGLVAALILGQSTSALASVIPSKAQENDPARAASLAQVREVLARAEVGQALAAQGLRSADIEQRLSRLSDEDVRALAMNLDQIQAAGDVPKYIWILLAAFLAVSTLAIIL